jgi:outer membrane biosynthesis protein TonB
MALHGNTRNWSLSLIAVFFCVIATSREDPATHVQDSPLTSIDSSPMTVESHEDSRASNAHILRSLTAEEEAEAAAVSSPSSANPLLEGLTDSLLVSPLLVDDSITPEANTLRGTEHQEPQQKKKNNRRRRSRRPRYTCIDPWKRCTDNWCTANCNHNPRYCPKSYCRAVPRPTKAPTKEPTTMEPTQEPTKEPTTKEPTQEPTNEPTTKEPTQVPTKEPTTKEPTQEPTSRPTPLPTAEPTKPLTVCADSSLSQDPTLPWEDSNGVRCDSYEHDNACDPYGHNYVNDGKTANQACCLCGGGETKPLTVCTDSSLSQDPTLPWEDNAGFTCDSYSNGNACDIYGHLYANDGKTANQACCLCGGGETDGNQVPLPTAEPTWAPTAGA